MIRELFLEDLSLWNCVWQSTLLVVIGLVGSFLIKRRPARAYQLLFLTMFAAVTVLIMSVVVKHFELGVFVTKPIAFQSEKVDLATIMSDRESADLSSQGTTNQLIEGSPEMVLPKGNYRNVRILSRMIVLVGWLSVTSILLIRLIIAFIDGVVLLRRAKSPVCENVQQAADSARTKLGITKSLQIHSSKQIHSPMIWCWSKTPVLLVPNDLDYNVDWVGVICHELAHWRRWDYLSGLIAEIIACILWWNPFIWWAKKRLVRLSEQACDDWVVSGGQPTENYARSLLNFKPQKQPAFVPAVLHSKKGVAARVGRILNDACSNPRTGVIWAVLISLMVACVTIGCAFMQTRPHVTEEQLYKQTKIAFSSGRDGNNEVYVMNPDGSQIRRLTRSPSFDQCSSWSPDGKKLAFVSGRDENPEIYIMNSDGTQQKNLTNNPAFDRRTSWSSDGKKIAFNSGRDGNLEIYVMNVDGSDQKNLTNNPAHDGRPCWSPDGRKIVFESTRDGNSEIYVMNADGSDQRNLTNNPADEHGPAWSPDGKKIAFDSNRDKEMYIVNGEEREILTSELYVMNADGSQQKRLTNNTALDERPSWSPDGKKIAFESTRDGNFEIYVMNADGTDQKNITNNSARDQLPFWSPFLSETIMSLYSADAGDIELKPDKQTYPLHFAAVEGDIEQIKLLIQEGVDVDMEDLQKKTPLHYAARTGKLEVVRLLVEAGADVNAMGRNEWPPLCIAVQYNHILVTKYLIAHGADIDPNNEWTPLQEALVNNNTELIELFLAKGADINAGPWTSLHEEVNKGRKNMVEFLIEKGADVNVKAYGEVSPLHVAARRGYRDIAQLLIAKGADINAKNDQGNTPLVIATIRGHTDIAKLLKEKGAQENIQSIEMAINLNNMEKLKELITQGADVNARDGRGNTPLFQAIIQEAINKGKLPFVKTLISEGADVNARNNSGGTPLHVAADRGLKEVVELLIASGANVNAKNNNNQTPLHLAANRVDEDLVGLLITKDADVNAKNNYGRTPLHLAVVRANKDIAEVLIAHKANVDARDKGGVTPLGLAEERRHSEISELLRKNGAKISVGVSETPLIEAVRAGDINKVQSLITGGADVNAKNNYGYTALHATCLIRGRINHAELLIAAGADVNAKDIDGHTPLWHAQDRGRTNIVELLRKHGAKE